MASTHAIASIAAELHRSWWVQWAILYAIPMVFFTLGRLVAMSSILDMTATPSERSAGNKAAGVFLGTLEDLIATTLLVVALILVECVGVVSSRTVQLRFRDQLVTSLVLRRLGLLARFLAALTLTVLWLAIVAADLLLVCIHHIRLTKAFDNSENDARTQIRHDVFFTPEAIVGVGGVALLLAGLFTWVVDLAHWLQQPVPTPSHEAPHHESLERTRLSTASSPRPSKTSTITPTYIDTNFVVFPSTPPQDALRDSDDSFIDGFVGRHVTIVSAPGDIDEYIEHSPTLEENPVSLRLSQPVVSKRPRSLTHRHRTIAVGVAALATFVLVESVVLAIAKTASPVVASVALNATLNEIMRGLFGVEFLPNVVPR